MKFRLPLLLVLLITLFGLAYYYLQATNPALFANLRTKFTPVESKTESSDLPESIPDPALLPKPSPVPLPKGKQVYNFSHGDEVKGPKIKTATFDPLDPPVGGKQTITLVLESSSPVTETNVIIYSDNQENNLKLTRTSGDSFNGTYQISWDFKDNHTTTYAIRYILKNEAETYDNKMFFH